MGKPQACSWRRDPLVTPSFLPRFDTFGFLLWSLFITSRRWRVVQAGR